MAEIADDHMGYIMDELEWLESDPEGAAERMGLPYYGYRSPIDYSQDELPF